MNGRCVRAAVAVLVLALALAAGNGCGRKAKPEPLRGAARSGGTDIILGSR